MQLLPTISTLCVDISAILMIIGIRQIKRKEVDKHRRTMTLSALFALGFFVIYEYRTIFIGNYAFGGPDSLKTFYLVFLTVHIIAATLGAGLGVVSLVSGYRNKLGLHRKIGKYTLAVWLLAAVTGLVVYFLLFVIYPNGNETSLLNSILGS